MPAAASIRQPQLQTSQCHCHPQTVANHHQSEGRGAQI